VARSPIVYQMYIIMKYLPAHTFMDVMEMPYMLKELLYQSILYDHGTDSEEEKGDNFINLDNATLDQIEKKLGGYKK